MNGQQTNGMSTSNLKDSIAEEAAQWLVTLRAYTFSKEDPHRDVATHHEAFVDWIRSSAAHLLIFMEMIEVERRFARLDESALEEIRMLLHQSHQ